MPSINLPLPTGILGGGVDPISLWRDQLSLRGRFSWPDPPYGHENRRWRGEADKIGKKVTPEEAGTWHDGGFCCGFQVSNMLHIFCKLHPFFYIVFMLTYLLLFEDDPYILYTQEIGCPNMIQHAGSVVWSGIGPHSHLVILGALHYTSIFPLERHWSMITLDLERLRDDHVGRSAW